MVKIKVHINCDLGEGMVNDADLMPYLHACNIACGGHFGDSETMRNAILLAIQHHVQVGAHPSFPDKLNFGRKDMDISPQELESSIRQQVSDFKVVCDDLGAEMNHIKLHGALYNLAARDEKVALTVLRALEVFTPIKLFVPYKSVIAGLAESKFDIRHEAFIDRRYENDLSLVNRTNKKASIEKPEEAYLQLISIKEKGQVMSVSEQPISIQAETFCVHGDNKNALEILQFIHAKLQEHE